MNKKGVNTAILEGKQLMADTVNGLLKEGIPPIVVSMVIEGLYNELNDLVAKTIDKEKEQVQKQQELNDSQVLYEPEDDQELDTEIYEETN